MPSREGEVAIPTGSNKGTGLLVSQLLISSVISGVSSDFRVGHLSLFIVKRTAADEVTHQRYNISLMLIDEK